MKYIDLHVHSNFSDGSNTPEELVKLAKENNLSTIALTDHDTINGISRAIKAGEKENIRVIPGVELSLEHITKSKKSVEIHVLGYNIDYTNEAVIEILDKVANERDNRNKQMCLNLQNAGYPISYEELTNRFNSNILTRAHFANFLHEKGCIPNVSAAFKKILAKDGPYYVERRYLSLKEGVELIKKADGIPVLAHPLLYKLSINELNALIDLLHSYGVNGIEAMYSRNHGNDEHFIRGIAREHGLFITGGTDFHGVNKPDLTIGKGEGNMQIPESILENLK